MPRDVLIILIVLGLLVGLGLLIGIGIYFCYARRLREKSGSWEKTGKRHTRKGDHSEDSRKRRPLPSAAVMKRADRGEILNGDKPADGINIMAGPQGNANIETDMPRGGTSFLREPADPADVAHAYMEGIVPARKPKTKQESNYEAHEKGKKKRSSREGKRADSSKERTKDGTNHWNDPPDDTAQVPRPETEEVYQNVADHVKPQPHPKNV